MQVIVVKICSISALIGFSLWFCKEPSFEPAIGFIVGIGGLAASFWPKRAAKYAANKIKGRKSFNYTNNNGLFSIGENELKFDTKWSKASDDSIHVYNYPASIRAVALVEDVHSINLISNASSYDFSSRSRTPREGDIVIFENKFGNFAAVKIIDIRDRTRSDNIDELTFEYVINPDKKVNFE